MLLTSGGSKHAGIGKTAFVSNFLWRCLSDVHFDGITTFVLDTRAGIYMVDRSSAGTGGDWRGSRYLAYNTRARCGTKAGTQNAVRA